jgi:hypothetical protein
MMSTPDLTNALWHKSSRSDGNGGQCVEVADNLQDVVAVRDTKNRDRGTLVFTRDGWSAFLAGMKTGEFDL